MDFLPKKINAYAEALTSPESPLLQKINRETHVLVMRPRMLSGHLQGRFLSMWSKAVQPKQILEIGTYTAYATICLAEGLSPGGKVITIEINEELEERIQRYLGEAQLTDTVNCLIGDAQDIIPTLPGPFDLVWMDADKENYSRYFDLVIDKVSPGGWILADNVLWSGKVVDAADDKDTRALTAFNEKVHRDKRVEHLLLPFRDGLMIMRKTQD
jgi:predicted O-methyltransferase YrrM